MKITSAIILMSISLCASLCCTGDDDYFGTQIYIENNNIVQVENNQNSYNVGESIIIETTIETTQITTNGQTIDLTNYDYSEINQSRYGYYLTLYKLNDFGTVSEIPLTTANLTVLEGNTSISGNSLFVDVIYNGIDYKNKFSITLPEAGTFYLAGDRFLSNGNGKLNINGGDYNLAYVNINSTIIEANTEGAFEFIVN